MTDVHKNAASRVISLARMKTNLLSLALVAVAAWSFAPSAAHAQISVGNTDLTALSQVQLTTTGANTSGDAYNFGEVIDAPSSTLTSVSVNIISGSNTGTASVFLASWNSGTNQATYIGGIGSALITGGVQNLSFTNLNVGLTAGTEYVIYVSSTVSDQTNAFLSGTQAVAPYDLGMIADLATGGNTGAVSSDTWSSYAVSGDNSLSFNAEFAGTTPEASTFALAGLGLCAALAVYRHQRRKVAPLASAVAAA